MEYINRGYKTYYLGVPENMIDSDKIKLYYNKFSPILLDNVLNYHNSGYIEDKSGCPEFIKREIDPNTGELFFLVNLKDRQITFDTIIFYSSDTNLPVGYTKFNYDQTSVIGEDRNGISEIKINTKFIINESGKFFLIFSNNSNPGAFNHLPLIAFSSPKGIV